jgi:hypothetical protein
MMLRLILTTLIGAAVVYFLDPDKGEERRRQVVKAFEDKSTEARDRLDSFAS